jgi:hypothetical protein
MLNRNPPAGGRDYSCNRPVRHPDESQDLRFLTITQIPDQVRNDGTAIVILTNPPAGGHNHA